MNTENLITITRTHFDHAKDIAAASVPFSDAVRAMCEQNACGYFGKSWTCPPAVGTIETLRSGISHFTRFLVFDKVFTLEDSYDWEGMVKSQKDFLKMVAATRKEIRSMPLKGSNAASDFLILGAGTCSICKTCTYVDNEPCRKPDEAIISVEAYGIDAMALMTENGLKYNNGPNTVTYVGGIFYTRMQE